MFTQGGGIVLNSQVLWCQSENGKNEHTRLTNLSSQFPYNPCLRVTSIPLSHFIKHNHHHHQSETTPSASDRVWWWVLPIDPITRIRKCCQRHTTIRLCFLKPSTPVLWPSCLLLCNCVVFYSYNSYARAKVCRSADPHQFCCVLLEDLCTTLWRLSSWERSVDQERRCCNHRQRHYATGDFLLSQRLMCPGYPPSQLRRGFHCGETSQTLHSDFATAWALMFPQNNLQLRHSRTTRSFQTVCPRPSLFSLPDTPCHPRHADEEQCELDDLFIHGPIPQDLLLHESPPVLWRLYALQHIVDKEIC